ncbi:double-cubane-cluster-containing anaerobic reductase [Halodesulfovibrio sp.]|jgi:benzoyl-CoA reductase/2-hydroxyglutaryl-CoA dehydratase subunit BcrC/BadD/HgdB|uniref:double-cubane-cluster-containing anaerobic reductase n=1 Tax=Halodesulfovibrio sp. TaxID=1912772 RepID=UPI0025EB6370|nr:double-cubane-cluster-containing anaerobic reductase [Halodesulfovibrio sp.]MCT4625507.1 double-cubane-cluster-containing anaerobic reductase [Halodesulfovibrio sp.]
MSTTEELFACIDRFKSIPEQSIAEFDDFKEQGGLVVGVYCIYAPSELIRAAGAIPVGLCGKRHAPIQAAENHLPASLCPLIKSSYGYAITDNCPFFSLSDVLAAESTCDGKKKMYELMGELKPMHVMQLPHTQEGEAVRRYWVDSLHELETFLVEHGASSIDPKELQHQIELHNQMRTKLSQVMLLAAAEHSPLRGADLLAVQESKGFVVDVERYLELLDALEQKLCAYLEQPQPAPKRSPRIMLTGVPVGKGSEKVIRIAEELGARVVCMENCTGAKGLDLLVDENSSPYEALAERYLGIPCSCMSPNPGRRESIRELGTQYAVDGVIDLSWLGCHTYNTEAYSVQKWVEESLEVPSLHLETDYSDSDVEQLRTRIEAYLELIDL